MTAKIIPVPLFDLVVFGGTGDLTLRKLLPALYYRFRDGQMPEGSRIVAVARGALTNRDYLAMVREALGEHVAAADLDQALLEKFCDALSFVHLDATKDEGWEALAKALADGGDRPREFYLATAPQLFGPICQPAAAANLVTPQTRAVREKPICTVPASAVQINDEVGKALC